MLFAVFVCSAVFLKFYRFTYIADNFVNLFGNCFRCPFNFVCRVFCFASTGFLLRLNDFVQNANKIAVVYLNDAASVVCLDCIKHLIAALLFNHSGDIAINPFCGVERNCLTTVVNILLQLFGQCMTVLIGHLRLFLLSCLAAIVKQVESAILFSCLDSCFFLRAELSFFFTCRSLFWGCLRSCRSLFWGCLRSCRSSGDLSLFTSCEYGFDSLLVFITCCCQKSVQLLRCHLRKFLCCHNAVNFELLLKCYCLILILQIYYVFLNY